MIFAADDVGHAHRDVVDHVHQVKYRIAVGAYDHEVLVFHTLYPAADPILDHHGRPLDLGDGFLAVLVDDLVALAEEL